MGATAFLILAVVVSVSEASVYEPGTVINGNAGDDYNDDPYDYTDNGSQRDLNQVDREKLLAAVTALLQQDSNPYSSFTDLYTFKGKKGLNRVSWRKWRGWNRNQAIGVR